MYFHRDYPAAHIPDVSLMSLPMVSAEAILLNARIRSARQNFWDRSMSAKLPHEYDGLKLVLEAFVYIVDLKESVMRILVK